MAASAGGRSPERQARGAGAPGSKGAPRRKSAAPPNEASRRPGASDSAVDDHGGVGAAESSQSSPASAGRGTLGTLRRAHASMIVDCAIRCPGAPARLIRRRSALTTGRALAAGRPSTACLAFR